MNDRFILEGLFAEPDRNATIRLGDADDAADIDRLAALDERDPGESPHLVADDDGEIVAALSLTDGTAIGDPFRLTLPTIGLLRARARRLDAGGRGRRGRRWLAAMLAGLATVAVAAGAAVAATPSVLVSGKPVKIAPATKGFAIAVRCTSVHADCEGALDVKSAGKIKPYGSSPAAVARVGTFPFRIPAGATGTVRGRVYGPALAQAMLRGRVQLSLTPRALAGELGPVKTVLFTYRAAR